MIKGRLFVVNDKTIEQTIQTNIVSIATPELNGKHWLKTIADIMADMLQIEIGDYIFLWQTCTGTQKSRIYGVYRAISAPYYELSSSNDNFPFKINVEKAYVFNNPIDEYDVLNCPYIKTPLWTITGKKVAGKSRGTSPLSITEMSYLIKLLIGRNSDYSFIPFDSSRIINVKNPLKIDYSIKGTSNLLNPTLNSINPCLLPFFNNDYSVKYEKILETIFNQEMSARNEDFFKQLGIDVNKVVWFSNYLPYSIEQSEMDYLIIESEDSQTISRIFLIEFIKEKIDNPHIYRSILYSKWVNETLALGESITQPMIVCPLSYDFVAGENTQIRSLKLKEMQEYIINTVSEFSTKELQIFTYDFSTGKPQFIKKR